MTTIFYLVGTTAVLSGTLFGLAALWVACRPSYGSLGLLAIMLASLVPLGAYELLALHGVQVAVILAGLTLPRQLRRLWRKTKGRSDSFEQITTTRQFDLHGMFKGVLLTAMLFAILRHAAPSTVISGTPIDWKPWLLAGASAGAATLVAALLAWSSVRWHILLIVLACTAPCGAVLLNAWLQTIANFGSGGLRGEYLLLWLLLLGVAQPLLIFATLRLLPAARFNQSSVDGSSPNWSQQLARAALLALSLAAAYYIVPAYRMLLPPAIPPAKALPVPNGYDLFVHAQINWSQTPIPQGSLDYLLADQPLTGASLQAGQTFIANNALTLGQIRQGLSMPSSVPVDYRAFTRFPNANAMRNLSRALLVEANVAASVGEYTRATECHLDQLRFAHQMSRDGLLLDELVAISIATVGCGGLARSLPDCDVDTLARIAQALQTFESEREPWQAIFERDQLWGRLTLGWLGRLWQWVADERDDLRRAMTSVHARLDATLHLLMTETALRQIIEATGEPPQTLAELVPEYLAAVPTDPFSRQPGGVLIYRRTGVGYLLYSVGSNGLDDGGQWATREDATLDGIGDLFLDACGEVVR